MKAGVIHYAGGKDVKGGSTHTEFAANRHLKYAQFTLEEELSSQTEGLRQVYHHFLLANLLLPWLSPFMKWYRQPAGLGKDCFVPVKHLSGLYQRNRYKISDPSKAEH